MAKPENDDDDTIPEKQQKWGTWEELLLACAVHRHGTDSWNSVSSEIQNRTLNLRSLTASACRSRYFDLKNRFTQEPGLPESIAEISIDELRKLRVDELRREVEQYDLSISSLQSKVKKLEEEREFGLNKHDTEIEKSPDLDKIVEIHREPVPTPPMNDSVSPDPKENSPGTGSTNGGEAKLDGEGSCRGSCESVEKEAAVNSERVETVGRTELTESEGGGNGGGEAGKETSDVQSSASLPVKGTSEPENEDQSPSTKDFLDESQPSISFVEILLSFPCGSHFSRRLGTQETLEYGKIIREHIDFEIIRKRNEEGWYKTSMNKLFRDLLLLINNARVFYQKRTSEFNFANQLNVLVKKQMTTTTTTTTLKKPKEISPPPKEKNSCLELVPFVETVAKNVSSKPRMSVPIVACRKRSSLATKPLLLLLPPGSDKKTDHVVDLVDVGEEDDDDNKPLVSKKTTRRKVAIRNVKNRDSEVKKTDEEKIKGSSSSSSNKSGSSQKKSAAASFLKRIKVGSSSSSDAVVETLKPNSGKKRAITTTGKNQANEKASLVKKTNGRAMKRASSSSSSPVLGKRSREASQEKEGGSSSSTRSKKRVRR